MAVSSGIPAEEPSVFAAPNRIKLWPRHKAENPASTARLIESQEVGLVLMPAVRRADLLGRPLAGWPADID
jgi:hypothetical protein